MTAARPLSPSTSFIVAALLPCAALTWAGCPTTTDGGPADAGSEPDAGPFVGPVVANLVIDGEPDHGLGIFDPSIAATSTAVATLAYSVVNADAVNVSTRTATSADGGATWTFASLVNDNEAITVSTSDSSVCQAASCAGTLIHEVSTLVDDDGDDDAARRFKIISHTYFVRGPGAGLRREIGFLSLYTAPSAAGPWSETPLLGWNGSSSFSSTGVVQNISTDAALAALSGCALISEPAALVDVDGTLDLAVTCFRVDGGLHSEVDLLRSTDHARSFSFVATMLSSDDATALGAPDRVVSAPDLFQIDGGTFLFVTLDGSVDFPTGAASGYRGCELLAVDDLGAGTVARSGDGSPHLFDEIRGADGQFLGACTYAQNAGAFGVGIPVLSFTSPDIFGIMTTGRPP